MLDHLVPPPLAQMGPPLTTFRFLVVFLGIGDLPIPNPIDVRFNSVSGLSAGFSDGGEIDYGGIVKHKLNKKTSGKLVLTRGFIPGISPLRIEIMSLLAAKEPEMKPRTILVMALDDVGMPFANWIISDAILLDYSFNGFDADKNEFLIESMTFWYSDIRQLSL